MKRINPIFSALSKTNPIILKITNYVPRCSIITYNTKNKNITEYNSIPEIALNIKVKKKKDNLLIYRYVIKTRRGTA